MKILSPGPILVAGILLTGSGTWATAQTGAQTPDAHHPQTAQAAPQVDGPGVGKSKQMPGMMEMMTPEMIQMMRGMMGEAMLSGMMGQSEGPLADGASAGRMLPMMAGARLAADIHTMIGAMGVLYGMPPGAQEEMTPERVRELLEKILAWHNNPRLRIGEISTAADGSIIAEIVTIDGSLVQKLSFNHYPGLVRQIVD